MCSSNQIIETRMYHNPALCMASYTILLHVTLLWKSISCFVWLFYLLQWSTEWVIYILYLVHHFFCHNAIWRQCNYGYLTLHYRTLIPKLLKVNQMAAGSRLPKYSHGFFFFHLLSNTLCSVNKTILSLHLYMWPDLGKPI